MSSNFFVNNPDTIEPVVKCFQLSKIRGRLIDGIRTNYLTFVTKTKKNEKENLFKKITDYVLHHGYHIGFLQFHEGAGYHHVSIPARGS